MTNKNQRELIGLTLSGFKSIFTKQSVRLGPLTLLSGANSSGKSSVTQALLLLKQTVEAPYDPGALMLNGPNVRMTSAAQLLAKSGHSSRASFNIGLAFADGYSYESTFRKNISSPGGFELENIKLKSHETVFDISLKSTSDELMEVFKKLEKSWSPLSIFREGDKSVGVELTRNRCTFEVTFYQKKFKESLEKKTIFFKIPLPNGHRVDSLLQRIIHVPGLRGNPERMYATTAVGERFPGRFETYVASIIRNWQDTKSPKFDSLNSQLQSLGLTASLQTQRISDTEVEIRVCRKKGARTSPGLSLVSIADVGFGVSQVLPVLVALLVADKGQTVIIEQPELHLHPRAQTKLAEVICSAVGLGVRVVIETHSSLLLLGIQTSVAKGQLKSDQVALNWFSTNENGHTRVSSGEISKVGSFGDWPTDFMDVLLDAESAYLDAVEQQMSASHGNQ